MASRFRWYTPFWQQVVNPLGADLALTDSQSIQLITPEGLFADTISETDVRVTRIIGQYRVWFNGVEFPDALARSLYIHNRVYVVSGDGTNIFNRDLTNIIDADADMLWNQIDFMARSQLSSTDQANMGTWGGAGPGSTDTYANVKPFMMGRMGHFDIKVDRRIEEGESLVWKTQLEPGNNALASGPNMGRMYIDMWVRCLVKTYG